MSKAKFLQNLEEISDEFINESWADNLFTQAQEVFSDYDDEIEELKEEVKEKEDEIEELEEEVNELNERLDKANELELDIENTPYDNLRGKMVFEKLYLNLDYIPIKELETLVEKHAVL
jgi:chromosome segregation ATPase